jgi:hypothetical protein
MRAVCWVHDSCIKVVMKPGARDVEGQRHRTPNH